MRGGRRESVTNGSTTGTDEAKGTVSGSTDRLTHLSFLISDSSSPHACKYRSDYDSFHDAPNKADVLGCFPSAHC